MTYVFIAIILFLLYALYCACQYANKQAKQAAEYRKIAVYLERKYTEKSIIGEHENAMPPEYQNREAHK